MCLRLTKLFISIFYWVINSILILFSGKRQQQGIILLYHDIPDQYKIRFQLQMDMVLKYSQTVPADFVKKNDVKKRFIAVTFDDGYRSIIQNVIPEITKRKIPITIFIPSGFLGKRSSWHDNDSYLSEEINIINDCELKEISENKFVTIGSHSISHPNLQLLNKKDIKNEISSSK